MSCFRSCLPNCFWAQETRISEYAEQSTDDQKQIVFPNVEAKKEELLQDSEEAGDMPKIHTSSELPEESSSMEKIADFPEGEDNIKHLIAVGTSEESVHKPCRTLVNISPCKSLQVWTQLRASMEKILLSPKKADQGVSCAMAPARGGALLEGGCHPDKDLTDNMNNSTGHDDGEIQLQSKQVDVSSLGGGGSQLSSRGSSAMDCSSWSRSRSASPEPSESDTRDIASGKGERKSRAGRRILSRMSCINSQGQLRVADRMPNPVQLPCRRVAQESASSSAVINVRSHGCYAIPEKRRRGQRNHDCITSRRLLAKPTDALHHTASDFLVETNHNLTARSPAGLKVPHQLNAGAKLNPTGRPEVVTANSKQKESLFSPLFEGVVQKREHAIRKEVQNFLRLEKTPKERNSNQEMQAVLRMLCHLPQEQRQIAHRHSHRLHERVRRSTSEFCLRDKRVIAHDPIRSRSEVSLTSSTGTMELSRRKTSDTREIMRFTPTFPFQTSHSTLDENTCDVYIHLVHQVLAVYPLYVLRTPHPDGGVSFSFAGSLDTSTPMEVDESPALTNMPMQLPFNQFIPHFTVPMPTNQPPLQHNQELLQQVQQLQNRLTLQYQALQNPDVQHQVQLQAQNQVLMGQLQQLNQLQQQLLQMIQNASNGSTPPIPGHVVFTEWVIVLHYMEKRKLTERPLGIISHEPLVDHDPECRRRRITRQQAPPDPPSTNQDTPATDPKGDIVDERYDIF